MITFEKAKEEEYRNCFDLVRERIAWMDEKGLNHWNKSDYLNVYPLEHYRKLEDTGELFVLKDDEKIVAFGALFEEDERWPDNECSFYLHHLCAKVSSKAYGKKFLYKAIGLSLKQGKKYLRLDSSADYPKLEEYYASFGFVPVGECTDGEYHGILRQLKLSDKKVLRKYIRSLEMDGDYIRQASFAIEKKVLLSEAYKKAQSIFVYLSSEREVFTDNIVEAALKAGKKVYVPKCDEEKMEAVRIDENSSFCLNAYGIREPEKEGEIAPGTDLIIIPCLAAGKDLGRLGHGKGYYDRYLKNHPGFRMVLCFDRCLIENIPMDDNDVRTDLLISEHNG